MINHIIDQIKNKKQSYLSIKPNEQYKLLQQYKFISIKKKKKKKK